MSEILLPEYLRNLKPVQLQEAPAPDADELTKNMAIPRPTGWRILCMVPPAAETFDGSSIVKADTVMRNEELTTTVLWVVAMGPECYTDTEKFPSGPWCAVGDFILTRAYAGTRFKVFGREFRLLNDDQVDAVVEDPRGITRT